MRDCRRVKGTLAAFLAVLTICVFLLNGAALAQETKSPERAKAEILVDRGIRLSNGSQEEEDLYLEAQCLDPTYAKPLFNLGLVFWDRKAYKVALSYFQKYVAYVPDSAEGLYQLAATYDNLGDVQQARKYYDLFLSPKASSGSKDSRYVAAAKDALTRLNADDSTAPANRHSVKVINILNKYNNASVQEIVQILSRPRTRGIYRFDGPVYATDRIGFEKDSAILRPEAKQFLDKVGEAMSDKSLADVGFGIDGHASTEGATEHNRLLSVCRAEAVKDYLSKNWGIKPSRITIKGFGAERPLIPQEMTEDDRARNRRVEFENTGRSGVTVDTANVGTAPQ